MGNPQRFITRTLIFLVVALGVAAVLFPVIWQAFLYNPWLNGLILTVLLTGIVYNLRRMWSLRAELEWIDGYRMGNVGHKEDAPRLMAPIAAVLLGGRDRYSRSTALSTLSVRHLLDSTSARLDETRDIARYQTGLMIFLGLLGTFWGLLEAINAISGVIDGLSLRSGDFAAVFNEMKAGLSRPLNGMGTAFGSSLFGLAGSLVLGFLDLQATQAQNGFYDELEEWLAGMTRHGSAEATASDVQPVPFAGAGQPMPAYVNALLQGAAETLDRMGSVLDREDGSRSRLQATLDRIAERLDIVGERLGAEQELLVRLAESQHTMLSELGRQSFAVGPGALDEPTRAHIRSTDLQLGRLLEELARGRAELVREVRHEIRLVTRTIAAAAGTPQLVKD